MNLAPVCHGMQKSSVYQFSENLFFCQPLPLDQVPKNLLRVDEDRVKSKENREEETE